MKNCQYFFVDIMFIQHVTLNFHLLMLYVTLAWLIQMFACKYFLGLNPFLQSLYRFSCYLHNVELRYLASEPDCKCLTLDLFCVNAVQCTHSMKPIFPIIQFLPLPAYKTSSKFSCRNKT